MTEPFDPETFDWDGDFVLDDGYRFVSVAKSINPGAAPAIGRNVWDAYGGETTFRASLEAVFATGTPVGFRSYFDGAVLETYVCMTGRYVRVRYRVITTVDISTLESMLETMRVATEELARPFGSPRRDPAESARPKRQRVTTSAANLRVVEGHESA